MGILFKRIVLAGAILLISSLPLAAQNTAGSITGAVQDAQGSVVPNAKVTLSTDAQGAASGRTVVMNAEGAFVFSPVLPGNYTFTVEGAGFKKYVSSGITLPITYPGIRSRNGIYYPHA